MNSSARNTTKLISAITYVATIAAVCGLSVWLSAGPAAANPVGKVRVAPQDKQQFSHVFSGEYDIVEFYNEEFVLYVDSAGQARLREYGIPFTVEIPDMTAFYQQRFQAEQPLQGEAQLSAMGGYETYSEIVAHLDSTAAANPTLMTPKFSIGQSIEGRDLWVVKISDNPNVDEDEPEVFLASLIHAREPAGAAVTLAVMDYLTANYGSDAYVTNLVDTREIFILPVYNPDGYVHNQLIAP
ncbi:MAG: hypothetical protein IH914_10660, partial [candidate division Zixibacteria bacterium]|nr:hypothetical protein [candidate division Zixibacteria bacterium]